MPALHIQLLGDFRLIYGEEPVVSVNTPRLQSLLAYLVLHRDAPQLRQHLAFLFWPDSTEAQARTNLRYLLHQLRQALPDADRFVHADTQTLQWRPDASSTLDVADFENAVTQAERGGEAPAIQAALERAVTLYQGDLLPGCYDDWVIPIRERLRQAFISAVEQLTLLLEGQGDYHAAINYAQRLLRHDPLHEVTYRRLMRLYAAIGDRARAVGVYHTCTTVLQRELAVEPSAATREAYEYLLADVGEWPRQGDKGTGRQGDRLPLPLSPPLPVSPSPLHNLPFQLTSFIGREREIAEVSQLLSSARLLTLTGPAGCGKTRLALQVAADLLSGNADRKLADGEERTESEAAVQPPMPFQDGVWWVELAALTDPAFVPQAVASTLGARGHADQALLETLSEHLRSRNLLLVFDNCEHLIEACAHLAETLLRTCPHLRIMTTSREALGIPGEVVWLVPPLPFPNPTNLQSPISNLQSDYEAVRLFVERAEVVLPTFTLTRQNALSVAQICQRLDGIPLAIELAAARVKVLSVEQIAARLDDRFRLLTAGSRTALPRHQTLQAAIDWSYELLSEQERALFRRLSVFAGGFTLEAAEAVCAGQVGRDAISSYDVLDLLAHLVDKSLVAAKAKGSGARYWLLETVRQYGRDRLREFGEEEVIQQRHANYFLQLAEEAERHLTGSQQVAWLERLEVEHDNLRAALTWSQNGNGNDEAGLRLASALWQFWEVRGYLVEGRGWLESMLDSGTDVGDESAIRNRALHPERTSKIAKALFAAGALAWGQSDYATARSCLQASVALWRELGDKPGLGYALIYLGLVELRQGNYTLARSLFGESRSLFHEVKDMRGLVLSLNHLGNLASRQGDQAAAYSHFEHALTMREEVGDKKLIASVLNNFGEMSRCQEDYDQAAALYEESLSLYQELGDEQSLAMVLHNLAYVARHQEDYRRAAALFEQCLAVYREQDNRRGLALCLAGLAGVAAAEGRPERAARLFGAADDLLDAIGSIMSAADRIEFDRGVAAVRTQLGQPALATAWAEGRAMTLEQMLEEALQVESLDSAQDRR